MAGAARIINPPESVPLDDADMPFWQAVLSEFARSEWTDHQLHMAALLTRMISDLEKEQKLCRQEGSIIKSKSGKRTINPRKSVVHSLTRDILSIRRSLSLHAPGKYGDPRDKAKRTAAAKAIEAASPMADDLDDLLAKPFMN